MSRWHIAPMPAEGWSDQRVRPNGVVVSRTVAHHGSDCRDECPGSRVRPVTYNGVTGRESSRYCRGIVVKRIDYPNGTSVGFVFGDWSEGPVFLRSTTLRTTSQGFVYGGGFWNRVRLHGLHQPRLCQRAEPLPGESTFVLVLPEKKPTYAGVTR